MNDGPAASRYSKGDWVLVRAEFPPGHARAPWYTRGNTGEVVRVTGELDTNDYEDVLKAAGLVDIKGAGKNYDGSYYVNEVTHKFDLDESGWQRCWQLGSSCF